MSIERFRPDTLLDGLLRPVLMAEPAFMHYFESLAPDLRYVFLLLLIVCTVFWRRPRQTLIDSTIHRLLGTSPKGAGRRVSGGPERSEEWALAHRGRGVEAMKSMAYSPHSNTPPEGESIAQRFPRELTQAQIKYLLLIALSFYMWCYIAGNGRYYVAGLMLPGPAIILLWRHLPGTGYFRITILIISCLLHLAAIMAVYDSDPWRWSRWQAGPAVGMTLPTELDRGVAFLTLGVNTYSAFAPHANWNTSWINLRDRSSLDEQTHNRVKHILHSKPSYALFAKEHNDGRESLQPSMNQKANVDRWFSAYPIRLGADNCISIDFASQEMKFGAAKGFWACPVVWNEQAKQSKHDRTAPASIRQAMSSIEAKCPKHFQPNAGIDIDVTQGWLRSYTGTEMRLFVEDNNVYYAYYLTLAGTRIGTIQEVLQGNFELDCQRLVGRYRPPWLR